MLKIAPTAAVAALLLATSASLPASAQESGGDTLKGQAALGGWQQDEPGVKRLLTPQDLPPIGTSAATIAEVVPVPPGAKPRVPAGFSVDLVVADLLGPRVIRVAPNGDLFIAESEANRVRVLQVADGGVKVVKNEIFASDLSRPYGIAFYPAGPDPSWVYIANTDSVVRYPYKNGDLVATAKPERIVERIPWVHHWTRDIAFTPDGKRFLLSVGSGSNVALDMIPEPLSKGGLQAWIETKPLGSTWDTEERRADVLSFDPDGRNEKIVRPACATARASPFSLRPAIPGAWSMSATSSATIRRSNMRRRSSKARSMAGPGIISAPTRIRARVAAARI